MAKDTTLLLGLLLLVVVVGWNSYDVDKNKEKIKEQDLSISSVVSSVKALTTETANMQKNLTKLFDQLVETTETLQNVEDRSLQRDRDILVLIKDLGEAIENMEYQIAIMEQRVDCIDEYNMPKQVDTVVISETKEQKIASKKPL